MKKFYEVKEIDISHSERFGEISLELIKRGKGRGSIRDVLVDKILLDKGTLVRIESTGLGPIVSITRK